jgi:hypothetical protein
MAKRPGERWSGFAERVGNAFGLVFLLVLATFAVGFLVPFHGWGAVALTALGGLTATVAVGSAGASATTVRLAAALAAAALVLAVVAVIAGNGTPSGVGALVVVALLVMAAAKVLGTVITEREVGFRTILGAISVYVMLGLLFAFVYASVDRLQSGSFFGTTIHTGDYLFFSVTTLTTTGYGNLVPVGRFGRMLAGFEMLLGQIFLVTLIAGLVSVWRPGQRVTGRGAGGH